MIFRTPSKPSEPLRAAIHQAYLADEADVVQTLLKQAQLTSKQQECIHDRARELIIRVREKNKSISGLDAFLHEYDLSSQEGVLLMCLAEALIRIPDTDTADRLIRDKLVHAEWQRHIGQSPSLLVNASTWGLMLTGKIIELDTEGISDLPGIFGRLLSRSSEPAIRTALKEAMRILGQQFVMGRTIEEAIKRSNDSENKHYRYSFDMLGEAALTKNDAERYLSAYLDAIKTIAATIESTNDVYNAPSLSIKLSALHPRFTFSQRRRVQQELIPRVSTIVCAAKNAGIGLTIDAEEVDRLDITLDVFAAVFRDSALKDWSGLGLAVQTYQKRALPVLQWLQVLSKEQGRRIMLRLVKGAYWDSEIKLAQQQGLSGYPVFTRKVNTDLSYLVCAKYIIDAKDAFYPQFASHNAYTIATILEIVKPDMGFEFQRLHGMGEAVYEEVIQNNAAIPCRTYAPVGAHAELLPYLVRRLLENGANTSFVNRIENAQCDVDELLKDPVTETHSLGDHVAHPAIVLPARLFGKDRLNSKGYNFNDTVTLHKLQQSLQDAGRHTWLASPLIDGKPKSGQPRPVLSPANPEQVVGELIEASRKDVDAALDVVHRFKNEWARQTINQRSNIIESAADQLEQQAAKLIYLSVCEGGRCLRDAHDEVREAIDSCRYYAMLARRQLINETLPGPTGEANTLSYRGRGTMACISPWNFPIALFTGQVVAALVAGNTVVAKPSQHTPLTAMYIVQLLHRAGVPTSALQFLPGPSSAIGPALIGDPRIDGVLFTGSTETAMAINQQLAKRIGLIAMLVAETGGQNAMIVDSSALPEHIVNDVLVSAFNSAGQRCSALRVLFLQNDIAPRVLELLFGAMEELIVGDPILLETDIGPLIDKQAKKNINQHIKLLRNNAIFLQQAVLPKGLGKGYFLSPAVFEIESMDMLSKEVFGPVLHIVRYSSDRLDTVIDAINRSGYGLTLGIHSRIEATANYIAKRVRVGNVYVNRNMVGAVIGSQPFGGEGLSGTGPKAGGPNYLHRLVTERTFTFNTAAIGGNATLLNLGEERK